MIVKTKPVDWFVERVIVHDYYKGLVVCCNKSSIGNSILMHEILILNRILKVKKLSHIDSYLFINNKYGIIPKICICNYDN